MLVLETLDAALARNAPIFAEIVGFGMSADAHHITQPQSDGAEPRAACESPKGRQAPSPDQSRLHQRPRHRHPGQRRRRSRRHPQGLRPRAANIPISSTKGLHGHSIGATPPSKPSSPPSPSTAASSPSTPALSPTVDPTRQPRHHPQLPAPIDPSPQIALSNSLAFGGLNAVLALRATSPENSPHTRSPIDFIQRSHRPASCCTSLWNSKQTATARGSYSFPRAGLARLFTQ
jgi:nodulation protein E